MSVASIEHAAFMQTDANVGSFDAGYGSALLARQVGDKRAREIFFLAEKYDAVTAERWGVVNRAVAHAELENTDLSVASIEHAAFMQTDANVGSFDAGYGSALLARQTGDKRAREIFFLAEKYDAETAERWGVVNRAVPHAELEHTALDWARTIARKSPQAIRMLKFAFNLADDGLAGQQVFAGEATRMAYMTAEAQEGRDAFVERRQPDWSDYPYYF